MRYQFIPKSLIYTRLHIPSLRRKCFHLQVFLRRITFAISVLLDSFLCSVFVCHERLDLLAIHVPGDVVGLPFLEAES